MSNSSTNESAATGNATNLVEVLYLDRGRLHSYAAQLGDGLTLLRRINAVAGSADTRFSAVTRVDSEKRTSRRTGGGSTHYVRIDTDHTSEDSTYQSSTGAHESESGYQQEEFGEEKAEHDNLLLLIEDSLYATGILTDFTGSIEKAGLYRFQGHMKFFDWGLFNSLVQSIGPVASMIPTNSPAMPDMVRMFTAMAQQMMSATGLQGVHVFMSGADELISAPLHPGYLALTRDQLRTVYLRSPSTFGTMIAYASPTGETVHIPGLPKLVQDLDLEAMMKDLTGDGIRVVPLAIYLPIEQSAKP